MGTTLGFGAQASHCSDFPCCAMRAPEHGLSSCGLLAYFPLGMWNLPGPGIEPVPPALAGRFLTTLSRGTSYIYIGGTKYNIFCEYIF